MESEKARRRGRPRKVISLGDVPIRKTGRRDVGRPRWTLELDPDRFAVVATMILLRRFKISERAASEIALMHFKPHSKSSETLRWKARKAREIQKAYRSVARVPRESDDPEVRILWKSSKWLYHASRMLSAAINKNYSYLSYDRISAIYVWAQLAGESAFADDALLPLVRSGFGFELPGSNYSFKSTFR